METIRPKAAGAGPEWPGTRCSCARTQAHASVPERRPASLLTRDREQITPAGPVYLPVDWPQWKPFGSHPPGMLQRSLTPTAPAARGFASPASGEGGPHSIYAWTRDEPGGHGGLVSMKLSLLLENNDKIAYQRSNCKILFGRFTSLKNTLYFLGEGY